MVTYPVTIQLPDRLYHRLQEIAEVSARPFEELLLRTIEGGMPPDVDRVRPQYRNDLLALYALTDQALMDMVMNQGAEAAPPSDWETLRRAYATRLLRWRGHPIPTPYELSVDQL